MKQTGAKKKLPSKLPLVVSWKPNPMTVESLKYLAQNQILSAVLFPVITEVFNWYLNKPKGNYIHSIIWKPMSVEIQNYQGNPPLYMT